MPLRWLALPTLILLALAGCSDSPSSSTPSGDDGPTGTTADVAALFPLDNSGTGCREGLVAKIVPMAQVAALLPEGFVPGDAQALLGLPAPTGRSAVFLTTFTCAQSPFGAGALLQSDLGALVQAPTAYQGSEVATLDFYVLSSYTTTPAVVAALTQAGHPVVQQAPEVSVGILPSGSATADGTVSDEEGVVASYHITAPAPRPYSALAHFWSATQAGLLYAEYSLDEVPTAAGTATCTLRAGALPAQVFGATDCSGQVIAMTLNDATWESSYVLLPDVQAA